MKNLVIKRSLPLFAVLMLTFVFFAFVGCQAGYSANSIKQNLENSGYTVSEAYDIVFDQGTDHEVKASELKGIQKIFSVVKGSVSDDDREFAIILVFDSIQNAESGINTDRLITLSRQAEYQCGDNKKESVSMGQHNNVVFAGCSTIKETSGLQ